MFQRQAKGFQSSVWTPAICQYREYVDASGLINYGASIGDTYRQVCVYVGRLLKDEKPAEMPIMRPTKFEV